MIECPRRKQGRKAHRELWIVAGPARRIEIGIAVWNIQIGQAAKMLPLPERDRRGLDPHCASPPPR